MPGSDVLAVSVERMQLRLDFVCHWRLDHQVWYRYRVPSHQFLLVTAGELRVLTSSGIVRIRPGEIACLRRMPENAYGFQGAVRYFEAHASFAPPPHQSAALHIDGEPLPEHVHLGDRLGAAVDAFDGMCRWIDREGDRTTLMLRRLFDQLLLAILGEARRRPLPTRQDVWQRARTLLEARLDRDLTVAAVAGSLGISSDHLIRGFRRRFGVSPMAYRVQARLRRAAAGLAEGQDAVTVKRLAHELGFHDASSFARAFRRQFGLSPSAWRVAGPSPPAAVPIDDAPGYALNRHLMPRGSTTAFFQWG